MINDFHFQDTKLVVKNQTEAVQKRQFERSFAAREEHEGHDGCTRNTMGFSTKSLLFPHNLFIFLLDFLCVYRFFVCFVLPFPFTHASTSLSIAKGQRRKGVFSFAPYFTLLLCVKHCAP